MGAVFRGVTGLRAEALSAVNLVGSEACWKPTFFLGLRGGVLISPSRTLALGYMVGSASTLGAVDPVALQSALSGYPLDTLATSLTSPSTFSFRRLMIRFLRFLPARDRGALLARL